MKKIIIIGSPGSGKSTFAATLSKKTGIEHTQLDALFWGPNWTQQPEKLLDLLEKVIAKERWIIDGNYFQTQSLTWPIADTIIWINPSFLRTFLQLLKRSLKHSIWKKELWPNNGNRESFKMLFSRESILLWMIKMYSVYTKKYEKALHDPALKHVHFVRLRTKREIQQFLLSL